MSKNRYLHIHPTEEWKVQPNLKNTQSKNIPSKKVDRKGGLKIDLVDRKSGQKTKDTILQLIASNPSISSTEMTKAIGINRSAISKHLKKLKEEGFIEHQGPAKGGIWRIL